MDFSTVGVALLEKFLASVASGLSPHFFLIFLPKYVRVRIFLCYVFSS